MSSKAGFILRNISLLWQTKLFLLPYPRWILRWINYEWKQAPQPWGCMNVKFLGALINHQSSTFILQSEVAGVLHVHIFDYILPLFLEVKIPNSWKLSKCLRTLRAFTLSSWYLSNVYSSLDPFYPLFRLWLPKLTLNIPHILQEWFQKKRVIVQPSILTVIKVHSVLLQRSWFYWSIRPRKVN